MNINRSNKKRWLLRKDLPGAAPKGNDKKDRVPWDNDDHDQKSYDSGATGPSIHDESDDSYPTNSHGDEVKNRYLGKPGEDYQTQTHGED